MKLLSKLICNFLQFFSSFCRPAQAFFTIEAIFLSLSVLFFLPLNATIHTVTVANFAFTPSSITNVLVGDTIRWVWVNGDHTTTCDPASQLSGNSLPAGAAVWNSPINSSNKIFSYRVTVAGTYKYWCIPHSPNMAASFTASNVPIVFIGLTSAGGSAGGGTVFSIKNSGTNFSIVKNLSTTTGTAPFETLLKGKDGAYYGTTSSGGKNNFGTIIKICGGTTSVLFSFDKNTNGGVPKGSLIQATDGNLYGMTTTGGTNGDGTIFRLKTSGNFAVLRNLKSATDGGSPQGSLVQGKDGLLYGMTSVGGTKNMGTIFKMSLTGTFTVLRNLTLSTDGGNPQGNLIQAKDGNFYGMTKNSGRIFKMTTGGTFKALHTFTSTTEGGSPLASLVQASDGNFFGTTSIGGKSGGGTIFRISSAGVFKVVRHLNPTTDGKTPKGNLFIGKDGIFYGLTSAGGTSSAGTIFKMTSAGTYSVLRHFKPAADGGNPLGSLIVTVINNLVAKPQSITAIENTNKTIILSGSGAATLSFNIKVAPKNGTLTGTGSTRTYTPKANFVGKDSFMFTANSGCLASPAVKVKITVTAAAPPIVLTHIDDRAVAINNTLTFAATVSSATEDQRFNYSLGDAPVGATIDAGSGLFLWKPTAAGIHTFRVNVNDNSIPLSSVDEQITVTVAEPAITLSTGKIFKSLLAQYAALSKSRR